MPSTSSPNTRKHCRVVPQETHSHSFFPSLAFTSLFPSFTISRTFFFSLSHSSMCLCGWWCYMPGLHSYFPCYFSFLQVLSLSFSPLSSSSHLQRNQLFSQAFGVPAVKQLLPTVPQESLLLSLSHTHTLAAVEMTWIINTERGAGALNGLPLDTKHLTYKTLTHTHTSDSLLRTLVVKYEDLQTFLRLHLQIPVPWPERKYA